MSTGIIVSVLDKTRLEYSYLAGTTSQSIVLRPSINVASYYYLQLFIRVHERNMSAGQSIRFALINSLPSSEDSREFVDTSNFLAVDLTSSAPTSAPGLVSGVASAPGPYLKFVATVSQASSPSTLYAEVSAVLLLRAA